VIKRTKGRVVKSTGILHLKEAFRPGRWNNRPGADWVVVTRQRPIARAWKGSSLGFF
jgi:hypothetical protein